MVKAIASILALVWTVFSPNHVQAEATSKSARLSWLSFECSVYADYFIKSDVSENVFAKGLSEGRQFLNAIGKGENEDGSLTKDAPVGLLIVLSGPSDDFILGRIYSAAADYASENVLQKTSDGKLLNTEGWVFDDQLQAAKARNLYQRANCSLLED